MNQLIPPMNAAGPWREIQYAQNREGVGVPCAIGRVERRRRAERRSNGTVASVCAVLAREPADRLAAGAGSMSGSAPSLGNVRLTKREQEIKELIEAGLGNKEIAQWLNIATNTVTSHVHNMLSKLAALMPPDRRSGNRRRRGTERSYRFSR